MSAYRHMKARPTRAYRVGRATRPCEYRPWSIPARGRFDGPDTGPDRFRSLYFSARKVGALIEVLQAFRSHEDTIKRLNALPDGDFGDDAPSDAFGTVRLSWLNDRRLATVELERNHRFFLVSSRENLNRLRIEMRHFLNRWGILDLDFATVLSKNREVR
jgi:hypothetical protein